MIWILVGWYVVGLVASFVMLLRREKAYIDVGDMLALLIVGLGGPVMLWWLLMQEYGDRPLWCTRDRRPK